MKGKRCERRWMGGCLVRMISVMWGLVMVWVFWWGIMMAGAAEGALGTWEEGRGYRSRALRPVSEGRVGFTLMDPGWTGITSSNRLTGDAWITNAVAHNGSGVAIGDVDGDGLPDLVLAQLEGPNRQYRNRGGLRFEEVSMGEAACAGQYSTGVVLADVDGDRDLDLLVNGLAVGTRLFLNDGAGRFTEVRDTGLSKGSTGMSMALADLDGDGDLDLYVAHYLDVVALADPTTRFSMRTEGGRQVVDRVNGQSAAVAPWKDRFRVRADGSVEELPEVDGLYRNEGGGRFTAIQHQPGVFLDAQGKALPPDRAWGLGVMFRDLNGDGAPDLYVANDTGSPDRLWLNTGGGGFRAAAPFSLRQGSYSSMGLDVADVNRDGHDDILVLDMLARDGARRRLQLSRGVFTREDQERALVRPMFSRNTLQMGRGDGTYAEVGLWAGVAASDWSWCPIFMDVDLDGYEDVLISAGFEQDVLDQDTSDGFRNRRWTAEQMKRYRQWYPRWPSPVMAFRNRGDGSFEWVGEAWGLKRVGVGQGMAAGDLDGDGDLDVVVQTLNDVPWVYRNDATAPRVAVQLRGRGGNTAGIGARMTLSGGRVEQSQEMISGGRYLSSDQAIRVFAATEGGGEGMRLEVRWRDGTRSRVEPVEAGRWYEVVQGEGGEAVAEGRVTGQGKGDAGGREREESQEVPWFEDVSSLLQHGHRESVYDDWLRQPLLPRRLSRLGPGVAWYDQDGDGWEDLMISGARGGVMTLFLNRRNGTFERMDTAEANAGDQGAVVGWPDGQGGRSLLVTESNDEQAPGVMSRLIEYSDKEAPREHSLGAMSPGPIVLGDWDGDGDLDVFVGGRMIPGRYPEAADSQVWRNEVGRLRWDGERSAVFAGLGLVTGATGVDLEGDGDMDLVVSLEWGRLVVFRNDGGRLALATEDVGMGDRTGLWTGVAAGDFDGDGRVDLAVGNWGRNSGYALDAPSSVRLAYGDWMGDGRLSMVEGVEGQGGWWPRMDRLWLDRGLPDLQALYPTHRAFVDVTLDALLATRQGTVRWLEVNEWESGVYLNRGERYEWVAFPKEAQWAPAFAVTVGDFDGDGREDVFLSQNFFGNPPGWGRGDAGLGLWLRGKGDGHFEAMTGQESGVRVYGEQRGAALGDYDRDGRVDLVVTQNNDVTRLFRNVRGQRGLRVVLRGGQGNPEGVGAQLRLVYGEGRRGPVRVVQGGSGYWSQDGAVQVMGRSGEVVGVEVAWLGGRRQRAEVRPGQAEVVVTATAGD